MNTVRAVTRAAMLAVTLAAVAAFVLGTVCLVTGVSPVGAVVLVLVFGGYWALLNMD